MGRHNGKTICIEVFQSNSIEVTERDKVFYDLLVEICERATDKLRIKLHASILVVIADSFSSHSIERIESASREKIPVLIIHQKESRIPRFSGDDEKDNERRICSMPYNNKHDVLEFIEEAILSLLSLSGRRYVASSKVTGIYDV